MEKISTCRAAYLLPFIEVLRDIGASVERELEKAKLPLMVEETPDDIVSNLASLEFLSRSADREGIEDLGWLWVKRFSASNFSSDLLAAMRPMPTVKQRLDCLSNLISLEDSDTCVGVLYHVGSAEVYCDSKSSEVSSDPISEWTQVTALIETIRSVTGETWSPDEIRFKSDFGVCDMAREANPNTNFIKQSAHTSIIVPSSVFATTKLTVGATHVPEPHTPDDPDGMENLKRLIRPYLRTAAPQMTLFAEIIGTSPRTLQRKFRQAGFSYSELIETTRFEMAAEMLKDPNIRLIDIAATLGYENQANFGRSFRRVAGISPGRYRREMFGRERAA